MRPADKAAEIQEIAGGVKRRAARPARELLRLFYEFKFKREPWPRWIDSQTCRVPASRVSGENFSVTFINHSTVLIQVDGMNILTDPVFSDRASPFRWAGPRRVRAPGIALSDLPEIDIILVSHNHYDHLDIVSLRAIVEQNKETAPLLLTGEGNGPLLQKHGLPGYREMKWGERSAFDNAEIIFTEARHGSGRSLRDQMEALWGAFVIHTTGGRKIYFAGDTAYGPHFREAAADHGPFDLSLIPIGAYEPRWFMKSVHLNPAEAVRAHLDLQSRTSIAIHHGTFQLTLEAIDAPILELEKALAGKAVPPESFRALDFGETLELR